MSHALLHASLRAILVGTFALYGFSCSEGEEALDQGERIGIPGEVAADGMGASEADTSCKVVLRSTTPLFQVDPRDGTTPMCGRGSTCSIQVVFDVDAEFMAGYPVPRVAYKLGDFWYGVDAWTSSSYPEIPPPPAGFSRFQALVPYARSIELIPFTESRFGGGADLLWDHNVNTGAYDNYVASAENGWSVQNDATARENLSNGMTTWQEALANACPGEAAP